MNKKEIKLYHSKLAPRYQYMVVGQAETKAGIEMVVIEHVRTGNDDCQGGCFAVSYERFKNEYAAIEVCSCCGKQK